MKLKGIVAHITKRSAGSRDIFLLQLSQESAKELKVGQVECTYFRSGLHLYEPVEIECEKKGAYYEVSSVAPYFSSNIQVAKYMELRLKGTGIGKKRIESLIDRYKESIFTMSREEFKEHLENDYKGKLSAKNIAAFLETWFIPMKTITQLEMFLSSYEVKYTVIEKMDEEYGKSAIERLKEDPYDTCIHFDLNRRTAETIAHDMGIKELDKRRIAGLVSYALVAAGSEGHTYLSAYEVAERVRNYSKRGIYKCDIPIICIANEISNNKYFYLDKEIGAVSLKYTYNEEVNCSIQLKRIQRNFKSGIRINDAKIKQIEDELNFTFAPEQKAAFYMLESGGVNILTGGPGTGKTTIIKGIIRYFEIMNPGKEILLCAPTGRAAKRMSESTGRYAQTIHKLIDYRPFGDSGAQRNQNNPLSAGLIVVDEVSMCDVAVLSMLLNAVPSDCRVLFVGDENQLPSVGAGNCLHDMIESNLFGVYRLVKNFRSDGAILGNANRVLEGKFPKDDNDTFRVMQVNSDEEGFKMLTRIMKHFYDVTDPFKCQLIEPSKKGSAGCYRLNEFMHKETHAFLGSKISDDIMVGDKIMFMRNEYKNKIDEDGNVTADVLYTNGEIAVVKHLTDEEVVIYDGDEERTLKRTVLNDAKLCYSYTIHKSQGSENEIIVIYLSGEDNVKCMMNRNLLYTAITRAKKKVILLYSKDALESCLNNEFFVNRKTRLLNLLLT